MLQQDAKRHQEAKRIEPAFEVKQASGGKERRAQHADTDDPRADAAFAFHDFRYLLWP